MIAISVSEIVRFFYPYSSVDTRKLEEGKRFELYIAPEYDGYQYQVHVSKNFGNFLIKGVIDLLHPDKREIIEIKNYTLSHPKTYERCRLQLSLYAFLLSNDDSEYYSFKLRVVTPFSEYQIHHIDYDELIRMIDQYIHARVLLSQALLSS